LAHPTEFTPAKHRSLVFSLAGRTALVTGASQGIGAAVARLLARRGARTVLAARNLDRLREIVGELEEEGHAAHALSLDLTRPAELRERLAELPAEASEIDILVNNAGITHDNLLARMSLEQWEEVLRTNLTGASALTREVVRGMMRRRYGRIVSVGSVVGLMGNAGQANYAASKAGLVGFSKSLARELGSRRVTVNVVAPGYIETAMTEALADEQREKLASAIALERLGTVDDVAVAVLFLVSEEAGYITGHVLNVSGGLYM
jgi:3-oxoacyl-[acyl-carrier protein] reductase